MSGDGNHFITGSYNNFFYLYDRQAKGNLCLEASKHLPKTKKASLPKAKKKGKGGKADEVNADSIDYDKKVLHASWHPKEHLIAIAASNNLFLYSAPFGVTTTPDGGAASVSALAGAAATGEEAKN